MSRILRARLVGAKCVLEMASAEVLPHISAIQAAAVQEILKKECATLTPDSRVNIAESIASVPFQQKHAAMLLKVLGDGFGSIASSRREQQDYVNILDFYTQEDWDGLLDAEVSDAEKFDIVTAIPLKLGLQIPTEFSWKCLHSILLSTSSTAAKGADHKKLDLEIFKTDYRRVVKRSKKKNNAIVYLPQLPSVSRFRASHSDLFNSVYGVGPGPVPCPITQRVKHMDASYQCRGMPRGGSVADPIGGGDGVSMLVQALKQITGGSQQASRDIDITFDDHRRRSSGLRRAITFDDHSSRADHPLALVQKGAGHATRSRSLLALPAGSETSAPSVSADGASPPAPPAESIAGMPAPPAGSISGAGPVARPVLLDDPRPVLRETSEGTGRSSTTEPKVEQPTSHQRTSRAQELYGMLQERDEQKKDAAAEKRKLDREAAKAAREQKPAAASKPAEEHTPVAAPTPAKKQKPAVALAAVVASTPAKKQKPAFALTPEKGAPPNKKGKKKKGKGKKKKVKGKEKGKKTKVVKIADAGPACADAGVAGGHLEPDKKRGAAPRVDHERSRMQYLFRSGMKGPGQSKSFTYGENGTFASGDLAKKAAEAMLAEHNKA